MEAFDDEGDASEAGSRELAEEEERLLEQSASMSQIDPLPCLPGQELLPQATQQQQQQYEKLTTEPPLDSQEATATSSAAHRQSDASSDSRPTKSYRPLQAQLDGHMPPSSLSVYCFDRTTGEPLPGAEVSVKVLDHKRSQRFKPGLSRRTVAGPDGTVRVQLVGGVPYVISASCPGYHEYGSAGEHLAVTLSTGESGQRSVGLVPQRVAAMVTLRELRPLAGKRREQDPFGHVNPLYSPPAVDPLALASPQKVSFYSPEGSKLTFMAMPIMTSQMLGVVEEGGQLVGSYSTDSEGHCFFYGLSSASQGLTKATSKSGKKFAPASPSKGGPAYTGGGLYGSGTGGRRGGSALTASAGGTQRLDNTSPSAAGLVTRLAEQFLTTHQGIGARASGAGRAAGASPGTAAELTSLRELEADDPEGLHNILAPGGYRISLSDPSRLVVFSTFSADDAHVEAPSSHDSIVPFHMPAPSLSEPFPSVPVQLYCRARPWFQIVVFDIHTLEEVGSQLRFPYTISKIDRSVPLRERIERVKRAMMAEGGATARSRRDQDPSLLDPELAAYLDLHEGKGTLARLWAKAEVSMVAQEGRASKAADGDGSFHMTAAREDLEELLEAELYQPCYEGQLEPDMERSLWINPGDSYAVEVHCTDPCLELSMRQARVCTWQLEPFVFYATRKVPVMVGVRQRYNQAPVTGLSVSVKLDSFPAAARPPVVKMEWCEDPKTYFERVIDQMIDFVVQSKRSEASRRVQKEFEIVTDREGLASFTAAPGSEITLTANVREEYQGYSAQAK